VDGGGGFGVAGGSAGAGISTPLPSWGAVGSAGVGDDGSAVHGRLDGATDAWFRWFWGWLERRYVGRERVLSGAEKVVRWLLARDLRGFNPSAAPQRTDWWAEAQEASVSPTAAVVRRKIDMWQDAGIEVARLDDLLQACAVEVRMDTGMTLTVQRLTRALGELGVYRKRVRPPRGLASSEQNKVRVAIFDRRWEEAEGGDLLEACTLARLLG